VKVNKAAVPGIIATPKSADIMNTCRINIIAQIGPIYSCSI